MKKILFALLFSTSVFAGYDFTTEPEKIFLQTQDGIVFTNAIFEYYIFTEHLHIPCTSDGHIIAPKCWRPFINKNGKILTDASGSATLPAMHFHSDSSRDRLGKMKNPAVLLWGVATPFQASNGKTYKCVAIQDYTLYNAKIKRIGYTIQATMAELQPVLDHLISICKSNVDNGRYLNTEFVFPY